MKTNCGPLPSWFCHLLALVPACLVLSSHVQADPPWGNTATIEVTSALVVDAKGNVTVDTGEAKAQPVKMQEGKPDKSVPAMLAGLGATLRTGPESAATIVIPSAGSVRVGADTEVRLPALPLGTPSNTPSTPASSTPSQMGRVSLELLKGTLYIKIDPAEVKKRGNATFRLKTPAALLAVKGTEFFATTEGTADTAGVHEGSIFVYEPVSDTSVILERGNAATITPGKISDPRRLTPQERRATSNHDISKIRQHVAVSKWDLSLPKKGTTNFASANPFGTLHKIELPGHSVGELPLIQDLLLDLSSAKGTPLAVQMLISGDYNERQTSPNKAVVEKASGLVVRASLSFAATPEAHQASVQIIPLDSSGRLSTLQFLLNGVSPLPLMGRVRFELYANPKMKNIGAGRFQITGVSILVAD